MIVKLDETTTAQLRELKKKASAASKTRIQGLTPVAKAVLQWAFTRLNDATIDELAHRMLTPKQRRKALIDEITSFDGQLEQDQLKSLLKRLEKLKRKNQVPENTAQKTAS